MPETWLEPERQTNRFSKESQHLPSVARFSVCGGQAPKLTSALFLAERIHLALVDLSDGSPIFTGCNSSRKPLQGHKHAYIFCESKNDFVRSMDGEITHATVFSRSGFQRREQEALQNLNRIWGPHDLEINLSLHGLGRPEDFSNDSPLMKKSKLWTSLTPFLPTRHAKRTRAGVPKRDERGIQIDSPEHELRRLLGLAGFPDPVAVDPVASIRIGISGMDLPWHGFRLRREKGESAQIQDGIGCGFQIEFSEEVQGPLALGAKSHFGMGLFGAEQREILRGIKEAPLRSECLLSKGDFHISLLEAGIRFITQANLHSWSGNDFRAGLGQKLRGRVCAIYDDASREAAIKTTRHFQCRDNCRLINYCIYGKLFRSSATKEQLKWITSSESLSPLILNPPAIGSYSPQDHTTVGLGTIGQASESIPYLILALCDLGKSGVGRDRHNGGGRFCLDSVDSLAFGERRSVYLNGNLQRRIEIFSYLDLLKQAKNFDGCLALQFSSLTCIREHNRYTTRPTLRRLIMHLLMRANWLASLHGTGPLYTSKESYDILLKAERVELLSAFVEEINPRQQFNRNNENVLRLPYFIGEIVYRGSFSNDIVALLTLGQIIHVGDGAEKGYGTYRIQQRS